MVNANKIIKNIKMNQDLDLQGCADIKKLGDYIESLEVKLESLRGDVCVYAREEMPEIIDDYSDNSDQEVLDWFAAYRKDVDG